MFVAKKLYFHARIVVKRTEQPSAEESVHSLVKRFNQTPVWGLLKLFYLD